MGGRTATRLKREKSRLTAVSGFHELFHYILDKTDALIDGERGHDIVMVIGERAQWVSMIRRGELVPLIYYAGRLSNSDLAASVIDESSDHFLAKADFKSFVETVGREDFVASIVNTLCT